MEPRGTPGAGITRYQNDIDLIASRPCSCYIWYLNFRDLKSEVGQSQGLDPGRPGLPAYINVSTQWFSGRFHKRKIPRTFENDYHDIQRRELLFV